MRIFSALLLFTAALQASTAEFEHNFGQGPKEFAVLAKAGPLRAALSPGGIDFLSPRTGSKVGIRWLDPLPSTWKLTDATNNSTRYCTTSTLCAVELPTYKQAIQAGIYVGIDLLLYGKDRNLEYDLIVHPGHDIRQVRFNIEGAEAALDKEGRLHAGPILQWAPRAYQEIEGRRQWVDARLLRLHSGEFTFAVGEYRRDLPLVIDPVLESAMLVNGDAEDRVLGVAAVSETESVAWGVTRSATWGRTQNQDVFVRFVRGGVIKTVIWGGSGDENVHNGVIGFSAQVVHLAGSTNSTDAPFSGDGSRSYGGGPSDGFYARVASFGPVSGTYIGGSGADSVSAIGLVSNSPPSEVVFLAGETGQPTWANSTVALGGLGSTDAFAGIWENGQFSMTVIGGADYDRATAVWLNAAGRWVVAGDTRSSDFPATNPANGGSDAWVATLDGTRTIAHLWGGPGDEMVTSMRGRGNTLYLAGTTTSNALPKARNSHQGGVDGFVAHLDAFTRESKDASFIGGPQDDFITAMTGEGDVIVAGYTHSPTINARGLESGQGAAGRDDAFLVMVDGLTNPTLGQRFGGSGDDRFYAIAQKASSYPTTSSTYVGGSSQSTDWLTSLGTQQRATGTDDGVVLRLSLPSADLNAVTSTTDAAQSAAEWNLGRNLQAPFTITGQTEPGSNGVLVIKSTDPTKLLVTDDFAVRGKEQVVLSWPQTATAVVALQALADEGEVEIILTGTASATSVPEKRYRVRLRPSALFGPAEPIQTYVGAEVNVGFFGAPLLPDGSAGPAQGLMPGVLPRLGWSTSDPEGLALASSDLMSLTASFKVLRAGEYTVSASSPVAPIARPVTVRTSPVVRLFPSSSVRISKDHFVYTFFSQQEGDSVRIWSSDPDRVAVGLTRDARGPSVQTPATPGAFNVFLTALSREGQAQVFAEGTLRGVPFRSTWDVQLCSYSLTMNIGRSVVVGGSIFGNLSTTPLCSAPTPPDATAVAGGISPAVLSGWQVTSSDPTVLEPVFNGDLNVTFRALKVGSAAPRIVGATVQFVAPPAIEVRSVALDFGSDIRVPAGGSAYISPEIVRLPSSEALVTYTLADTTKFRFTFSSSWVGSAFNFPEIIATNAKPGDRTTLTVTSPVLPPRTITVRAIEPLLIPANQEFTVEEGRELTVDLLTAGVDGDQIVNFNLASLNPPVQVSVQQDPPDICDIPPVVRPSRGLTFRCLRAGSTVLTLHPINGSVHARQSDFSIRISVTSARNRLILSQAQIAVGPGLQTRLYLDSTAAFHGVVRSADPSRVLISTNDRLRGAAEQTLQGLNSVLIQGVGGQGVTSVIIEAADGRRAEIPVFIYQPTLAVRASRVSPFDRAPRVARTIETAVSEPSLEVHVVAALVEPETGEVLMPSALHVVGGSAPFLVAGRSSDPEVAQPSPANALFEEGTASSPLQFHVRRKGEVMLTVTQPPGFVEVPASALSLRVTERELSFNRVLLGRNLQMGAFVRTVVYPYSVQQGTVDVTSLDPDKLLVSVFADATGRDRVTIAVGQQVFFQALDIVVPGERLRVRLSGSGFETSEEVIEIAAAELRPFSDQPLIVRPTAGPPLPSLSIQYGPVDPLMPGRIWQGFSGSLRPGVRIPLRITSSDPSVFTVVQPELLLTKAESVRINVIRPGEAVLRIEAPPEITNGAAAIPVVIQPWQFPSLSCRATRLVVTECNAYNLRPEPVAVQISSTGGVPLRLGTARTGSGTPGNGPLNLTLSPNGQTTKFFIEPLTGAGETAALTFTAPDYRTETFSTYVSPLMLQPAPTFVQAPLTAGMLNLTLVLTDSNGEVPLGSVLPRIRVDVRSSNTAVARPSVSSLEFTTGMSRQTISIPLTGRGSAMLTITFPTGVGSSTQDLNIPVAVQ